MKSDFYKNGVSLTPIVKSLKSKSETAFVTQQTQLICLVILFTVGIFLFAQPISAQQTVHIGSKSVVPEIVVNMSAIYGNSKTSFKQTLPLNQPSLRPIFRKSRLLIPNLRTANKPSIFKLRSPGSGGLAVSRATAISATRNATREESTADIRVAPTVTPPSSSIKPRDVLVGVLPSLLRKTDNDQSAELELTSELKKSAVKTKVKTASEKPKQMRTASVPKVPAKSAIKRLTPPPPPPPSSTAIIDKSELRTPKVSTTTKLIAKELKESSAKSTLKSRTKLDQLASLSSENERILEVRFRPGSLVLTRDDEKALLKLAQKLGPIAMRLQLKAFAEAAGNNSSKARRLSLSRALVVRSFLIENGLRSTRIDVRALGIARDGGAPDRVDIVSINR